MLPRKVRTIIADTEDSIYFSAVSSWQIVLKESIGKLRLPEEPALFILNGIVKNIWRCRGIFIGRR